jgi:hypothetical protein
MLRQLSYETRDDGATEVASDEAFGYGVSLSGRWQLGADDLRFMGTWGSAIGRYMGINAFNDAYVATDGDLDTIDQWGAVLAYRHSWNPRWRSTLSLSASGASNPGTGDYAGAGELPRAYRSLHANLNYLPAPGLQLGTEFLYGYKELEDGRDGDLTRLQFGVKYAF